MPTAIHFTDDKDYPWPRHYFAWPLFWTAWKWTGDRKYLDPIFDFGTTGIMTVNANLLDLLNLRKDWGPRILAGERGRPVDTHEGRHERRQLGGRVTAILPRNTSNGSSPATSGTWKNSTPHRLKTAICSITSTPRAVSWIDRVGVPSADLQRERLGGIALLRNATFPGHAVSWRFDAPANDQSVAILIPDATATGFKVIVYNLEMTPVHATMTGWNIDPGVWEITQGIDTNGDDVAEIELTSRTNVFERSASLDFTFAPRATTVLTLKLKKPGTPY